MEPQTIFSLYMFPTVWMLCGPRIGCLMIGLHLTCSFKCWGQATTNCLIIPCCSAIVLMHKAAFVELLVGRGSHNISHWTYNFSMQWHVVLWIAFPFTEFCFMSLWNMSCSDRNTSHVIARRPVPAGRVTSSHIPLHRYTFVHQGN